MSFLKTGASTVNLETTCTSWTGKFLYSDTYEYAGNPYDRTDDDKDKRVLPALNIFEAIPFVGVAGGLVRMALAIIHMIGHAIAACVCWNKGHLYHAAKGGTELLRGFIAAIPLFGVKFVWEQDGIWKCPPTRNSSYEHKNAFLIRIKNPNQVGRIDECLEARRDVARFFSGRTS